MRRPFWIGSCFDIHFNKDWRWSLKNNAKAIPTPPKANQNNGRLGLFIILFLILCLWKIVCVEYHTHL
jgi:hypothetical protein